MWEIDVLLEKSITHIKQSQLAQSNKRNIIWNLEQLPQTYELDAGGFKCTEVDEATSYTKLDAFSLGAMIVDAAVHSGEHELLYDWAAFLLNFGFTHLTSDGSAERKNIKEALSSIKKHYLAADFNTYQPIHASLTIYPEGNQWFAEAHNDLIKWFGQ